VVGVVSVEDDLAVLADLALAVGATHGLEGIHGESREVACLLEGLLKLFIHYTLKA